MNSCLVFSFRNNKGRRGGKETHTTALKLPIYWSVILAKKKKKERKGCLWVAWNARNSHLKYL